MTVERDFAGFVLPFATGIFLTAGIGAVGIISGPAGCTVSMTLTALMLMYMLHPVRKRLDAGWAWISIAVLGLCTGAFLGFSSSILGLGTCDSTLISWASGFGRGMGEAIDRIPFDNPQTGALVKALITGERSGIPKPLAEAFRDSGAAHILSLSGFHLGIIYAIVRWSLSFIGNSPRATTVRSAITIIVCGFYTLATGAGPSIVRAFLFILLGESARLLHRHRTTSSILLSALFLQLILSPSSIRSVSFQLSYAAMAGIAWIYPCLRNFWPGIPEDDSRFPRAMRWVWNSASMSIACQLTTAPLAYLYFASFPRHFLLTNLITLPLTTLLIPAALLTLLLHTLGLCPDLIITATEALAAALCRSLEIIAGM